MSTGNTDFQSSSGDIQFSASSGSFIDRRSCVNISVINDDVLEVDETFEVRLFVDDSIDQSEVTLVRNVTKVVILDDDSKLVI